MSLSNPAFHHQHVRPRKLTRNTRACDFCHKRSIRCRSTLENGDSRCENCADFDISCTYDRPAKKRGVKPSAFERIEAEPPRTADVYAPNPQRNIEQSSSVFLFPLAEKHQLTIICNSNKIANLVNVYFEVVYPIFPLFHRQNLQQRVISRIYFSNKPICAALMAICALASARVRDGALLPGHWEASYFKEPSPEAFYEAAVDILPRDLGSCRDFDYMRTCALLALWGIQIGKMEIMHQYLGLYHSLVAFNGLHDEKNWPKEIGIIETEERRRLFWSMYTLEVYTSIVWGGVIRCRESQSQVYYPSEVDDDFFSDVGFNVGSPSNDLTSTPIINVSSWLHGWNFTTEMYRILEHAMDEFHRRSSKNGGPFSPSELFARDAPQQSAVLAKVMSLHADLPARFKETRAVASEMSENIFSFQAANITATLQLVRMVMFTSEDATVDQKCDIARELLHGFAKVPVFFLRAISSPLLYHLAGIGSILGSAIEGPLSDTSYIQIRAVLLAMADLLASLEIGITRTVGASSRLRSQITKIDHYMVAHRQTEIPFSQVVDVYSQNHTYVVNQADRAEIFRSIPDMAYPNGSDYSQRISQWPSNSETELQQPSLMAVDGSRNQGVQSSINQFQFQIPPELLEDWPWPFDVQGAWDFNAS